jgi:hypothetical protein
MAPINSTAGFPISTDEAGEAVLGVGSDEEALDMLIQISHNKELVLSGTISRRTEAKKRARMF